MTIAFDCTCGKTLRAPDDAQGKRARCPTCGTLVTIPAPTTPQIRNEYDLSDIPPVPRLGSTIVRSSPVDASNSVSVRGSAARPAPVMATPLHARGRSLKSYSYVLFLLALIPLIISSLQKKPDKEEREANEGTRLVQTIDAHPEIVERMKQYVGQDGELHMSEEEFLDVVPDHRFVGALLGRDSRMHWIMGLGAAAGYFAFLLIAFPHAPRYFKGVLFSGVFTGTLGIVVLLFFQWAAFSMPMIIPHGVVGLVLLIIKLIGYSYALAEGNTGFVLSFIGFTCGVGLCEEITKVLPLLLRIRPTPGEEDPTWNSLLLWGIASGIGFGVAEGIMYSGRYYNGIESSGIYYVRFLSCVVLHAMWAGAVGVTLYRQQATLQGAENNWAYWGNVVLIVLVPMILHGLYDTLLKKDQDLFAVLVALASFAWLAYQIESAARQEPDAVATT